MYLPQYCNFEDGNRGDFDSEEHDLKGDLDDPNYDAPDPWDNPNDADYNVFEESATCSHNTDHLSERTKRCKTFCYEDIRL